VKWIPIAAFALFVVLMAACSDDDDDNGDEASPSPSVCDQKEALDESAQALADLDVVASGTDGLTAAVEAVQTDVQNLKETVSADVEPEVEALETAVSDAQDTLSGINDDSTLNERIDAVQEALTGIATAAAGVGTALQNECG
jgi:hypothetical protein